jgi:hypothetical protein
MKVIPGIQLVWMGASEAAAADPPAASKGRYDQKQESPDNGQVRLSLQTHVPRFDQHVWKVPKAEVSSLIHIAGDSRYAERCAEAAQGIIKGSA